ncbi:MULTISPECIES: alpha/beta hydrolase [unclassified Azospirillum]|uniref:alpha/beta hydrolase n=1 Tax=unclassified Azospirillum TaxID=2630922 RepID=UPI000B6EEB90|nr:MULTISPECIES: alpha/beta hydrolase [unclassified Azospirillum]SNS92080.1 hypothetical protein SAMN05880556_11563 [Azospirillum sp. RU38E]SNT09038.1 hypothetical protein SAMN05880591_11563 [Azospirillum sp. RU37A]
MSQEQPECRAAVWTDGRFSPAVLAALDQVITLAAAESGGKRLILVGYSGGGTAAALIAARRVDVDGLVTVAAPLDLKAWTSHHNISSLTASIDPATAVAALRGLRQLHVAGTEDATVPANFVVDFARRVGAPALVLQGLDHNGQWSKQWPEIWQAFLNAGHPPKG